MQRGAAAAEELFRKDQLRVQELQAELRQRQQQFERSMQQRQQEYEQQLEQLLHEHEQVQQLSIVLIQYSRLYSDHKISIMVYLGEQVELFKTALISECAH